MWKGNRVRKAMAVRSTCQDEPLSTEAQVSELKLASGTKATDKVILSVRTVNDVQFFGVNGSQIAASMSGMHLNWNGEVVVVTNDNFPDTERWLFPANISDIQWKLV